MLDFLWLASQATDGLLYAWPVTLGIIVILVVGALKARHCASSDWLFVARWAAIAWLFPLLVLGAGAAWAGTEAYPAESRWRSYSILALAAGLLVATGVAGFRASRVRLLVIAIGVSALWFTFWCLFMSGMSIADDWI